MKLVWVIFVFLMASGNVCSQPENDKFQMGAGCRLTLDLLYASGHGPWFNWKLAVSAGLANAFHVSSDHYYRPSIHADVCVLQGGARPTH